MRFQYNCWAKYVLPRPQSTHWVITLVTWIRDRYRYEELPNGICPNIYTNQSGLPEQMLLTFVAIICLNIPNGTKIPSAVNVMKAKMVTEVKE